MTDEPDRGRDRSKLTWRRRYVIIGSSILAISAGGAGATAALGDDDSSDGAGRERAKPAAPAIAPAPAERPLGRDRSDQD